MIVHTSFAIAPSVPIEHCTSDGIEEGLMPAYPRLDSPGHAVSMGTAAMPMQAEATQTTQQLCTDNPKGMEANLHRCGLNSTHEVPRNG